LVLAQRFFLGLFHGAIDSSVQQSLGGIDISTRNKQNNLGANCGIDTDGSLLLSIAEVSEVVVVTRLGEVASGAVPRRLTLELPDRRCEGHHADQCVLGRLSDAHIKADGGR
jgi:hypothetical protein